ncbi:DNA cytosine methyltransferase [Akkermansia muciniphila]|nr:DNA cytosine methyltransferase [Akkermansia muciniphila]MBT8792529.1 DNA cytosine methyltransferase [Akkermansia muciniphila]
MGAEKGGGVNELHLFAGAGGGILGSELLGFRTVCAVELEPYPASVLLARQNDGLLPPFPVWDDVRTFDGRPWRGLVDVVSGGFPCQDISAAGKGAGIDGARSGLWREMHRIINEVRPEFAFLENSPLLVGRGLARVLGDLAEIGYDAEWLVLGADDVGAPHVRKRIWILGMDRNADCIREEAEREVSGGQQAAKSIRVCGDVPKPPCLGSQETWPKQQATGIVRICPDVPDSNLTGLEGQRFQPGQSEVPEFGNYSQQISYPKNKRHVRGDREFSATEIPGNSRHHQQRGTQANDCGEWWSAEPDVGRVAHGVAARVDRLKAIGNGQVPAVAATAFRVLLGRFQEGKEGE